MIKNKKIGIIYDEDFALLHEPSYPKPSFISFETPLRVKYVIDYLQKQGIFENENIIRLHPLIISDSDLLLAHSAYHVDLIKRISEMGGGILDDEVFIKEDTFQLAKKAVGGAIKALTSLINNEVEYSLALIRPPGHHASIEKASGLCIFNNIVNAIQYVRQELNYNEKIAIIDIDDHYGDGIAQYFYEDPSVLYFSIHEYDFANPDVGFIDELGLNEGAGYTINFPVPEGIGDKEFQEIFEFLPSMLFKFSPGLIIVALGFDMYFADPIGNCYLTSQSYYNFAQKIAQLSRSCSNGKIAFVLEGGYSVTGLPICVKALIQGLLDESHHSEPFENLTFPEFKRSQDLESIMSMLRKILEPYWGNL